MAGDEQEGDVGIDGDTPGRCFYRRQVQYLMAKDVDRLVDEQYRDDAQIVSHDFVVKGRAALKAHFTALLAGFTIEEVASVDRFTETDDTVFFEATVRSSRGLVRTTDALVLDGGRIRYQFTGASPTTDHTDTEE